MRQGDPTGMTLPKPRSAPARAAEVAAESEVLSRYREHVSVGRTLLSHVAGGAVEVRSKGTRVWDRGGREFLNCGGYGLFFLGHGHPAVVEAVTEQLHRHPVATKILLEPEVATAAEALAGVAPPGLEYAHFTTSGAESVEVAMKLAWLSGKRRFIAMERAYHGSTLGALAATGGSLYREPFRGLLPEVVHVPFGDVDALASAVDDGEGEACVLLEPIQGEGGVNVPPQGFLKAVERLCRQTGTFLVVDEIQTGMGRIGRWWGVAEEGVVPDVLLAGKALGGGVAPVAAAVVSPAAYAPLNRDPVLHGSTFGGVPLAMAAVRATITTITEGGLVERARSLGERLVGALREILAEECPALVREVRGRGLLIGLEFTSPAVAGEFIFQMVDRGVLTNHSMTARSVVRLTPPVVMTEGDVDWLCSAASSAARQVALLHGN